MSNKTNRLAVKAIFLLIVIMGLLFVLLALVLQMPTLSSFFPFPKQEERVAMPISTPIPFTRKELSRSLAASPPALPEPEIRRAIPVEYTPIPPTPTRIVIIRPKISVTVVPESWSDLVEVPEGFTASVTFSLGRIRIERNGQESGVIYRNATLKAQKRGDDIVGSFNPFAVLDRTPRTLCFDRKTRTLRFLSLEKKSEEVVVCFSE